jgi:hypothetical protein
MMSPLAVKSLERLLIELEYAAADLARTKAPMTDDFQSGDWDARLLKLMVASRAVQTAIGGSGRKSPTELLNRAVYAIN